MKKKSLIALFLLFGIFLTGCLQNNIGLVIEKPVTVTLWHYYNGQQKDAFDALIDEFNHTEGFSKGITVKAESKGRFLKLTISGLRVSLFLEGMQPLTSCWWASTNWEAIFSKKPMTVSS